MDGKTLVRRREFFGIGRWEIYDLPAVAKLHVDCVGGGTWRERFGEFRRVDGPLQIAFEYHGEAERIGLALDEDEAKRVIAAIEEKRC